MPNETLLPSRQSYSSSSSSSMSHGTSPMPVEMRNRSASSSAALGTNRPDEPPPAAFELHVQEALSDNEVTELQGCLKTWKGQDEALGESRGGDADDFDRRVRNGEVQVDGKNVIFISNGLAPKLPHGFAEERDPQGTVVREARVTFVYPQPGFGQIEAGDSIEHKSGHDGKSQGQPGASASSSSGATTNPGPSFIVTPASPAATRPDSSSPSHVALASTSLRGSASSPRGSTNVSVSHGSASKLFKQLFRPRKSDTAAETSPETKLGVEPLPASAVLAPMSPAQWRRDYPHDLANTVLSNPNPLVPVLGMPLHLRDVRGGVFAQIGTLVDPGRHDFADCNAAVRLANTIMDQMRNPKLPAALAMDCMKELAQRVVATPSLPAHTAIFSEMSRLMIALKQHVDEHDSGALDLHAYLSHLSTNRAEE